MEEYYLLGGGEFWVIEHQEQLVGTGAYYPIKRGEKAVEIRKMYLLPTVRGLRLGKYLLQKLEQAIAARGFQQIWVETASVLIEAVTLYETSDYPKDYRCRDGKVRRRSPYSPNAKGFASLTGILRQALPFAPGVAEG